MRTSETIADLSAAIAKAQAELKNPPKNKINPHFKSKYADLASILETILPIYAEHGVSIVQGTSITDTGIVVHTRVMKGNEWLESIYPVCQFAAPQAQMSALTYAKRAALQCMGMVCGDDDLDGEDSKTVQTNVAPKKLDAHQSSELLTEILGELKLVDTKDKLLAWAKANQPKKETLIDSHKRRVEAEFALVQESFKGKVAA